MRYMIFFLAILSLSFLASAKKGSVDPEGAYVKMLALNEMRNSLASTLDSRIGQEINEETFKQTCGKVGQELQHWAALNRVSVRQFSDKNRNPSNGPSEKDQRILEMFRADPKLDRHFEGKKLYVRIPIVKSCLHCHGEKNARPRFIKLNYPQDKAFGYKVGDLRGLYSINF